MKIDKIQFQLTGLKGKALNTRFEVRDKLNISEDYTILVKAGVFTEQLFDNNDGTGNLLYKLAVKDVEIISKDIEQKLHDDCN